MLNKIHAKIGFLKYIDIFFYLGVIRKYISEYSNYLYFIRQIKKAKYDGVLERNKISTSSTNNEMYFAINLPPEYLLLNKDEMLKQEQMVVSNDIIKIENALSDYQLYDLIIFKYERISTLDYYAYGVTCKFNFKHVKKFNNRYLVLYPIFAAILYAAFFIL